MTRATIEREIERIEAIGRTRALDDRESGQLEHLINLERWTSDRRRRYAAERRSAPPAPRRGPGPRRSIVERLDDTIARMAREELSVRAIYLVATDLDELVTAGAIAGYRKAVYRGHPVRQGKSSLIYSTHGIARSVRASTR